MRLVQLFRAIEKIWFHKFSKIFKVTMSGKLFTLVLNALTGALLARGTSTTERGQIFAITSILTIIQVFETMATNERNLRQKTKGNMILNPVTQFASISALLIYLVIGLGLLDPINNLGIVFALVISLFNSRLMTYVFLQYGVAKDRLTQGLSAAFFGVS